MENEVKIVDKSQQQFSNTTSKNFNFLHMFAVRS